MNNQSRANGLILLGVVACFVLSGFAALLYQTAWMRQFSLVFGTSELAIAAVLSAYMGGLAVGASVAARYVNRIKRPVLFYGILEAGIAISALAVPLLMQLARLAYIAWFGGQAEPVDASGLGQSFFYLLAGFLVLVIPTALMGATLPLLTKYAVSSDDQIGSRVGLLYAANTVGAIGGTIVAAFLLLPRLGLNGTIWVGVAINLVVFVLAALIAHQVAQQPAASDKQKTNEQTKASTTDKAPEASGSRRWILPVMLLSGANSFVYEVLWTRLLGHVLGGSLSAFATMLAGFLSGIAIGSAIGSRFANTRAQAIKYFVFTQLGIALTSITIYQLLPFAIPDSAGLGNNVLFAILVLLPATICIGATFPLAVRILAVSQSDAAASSARVYSWNTVGAIAGATLAAFFIIPLLKYEGTIKLAVLLNVALALAASMLVSSRRNMAIGASLFSLCAILFLYNPKMPEEILRSSPVYPQPGGEIVFYEVGRSATVVVIEEDGNLYLRTNGLPEAAAKLRGSPPERRSQLYLSILPVLARPDADSMLIVGFGGGVTLEAVPKSVANIDVIELEPEVINANRFYGERRENNPLNDKRINIVVNDARSALALTTKKYDAIVSQPSHPWTAGASHLYTREFMQLAGEHLTDDGVFLQWMNVSFLDEFLLKALAASMLDVFPHVRMYQADPGTIFFLGSNQPIEIARQMALTGRPLNDDILTYFKRGIGAPEDLLVALTMDDKNLEEFSAGSPVITDNNNYMATTSSKVLDSGTTLSAYDLFDLLEDYDPLIELDKQLDRGLPEPINYSYISARLDAMNWHSRALGLAERLYREGDTQALVVNALGLQNQGNQNDSQTLFQQALKNDPENQQARWALLRPWFAHIFSQGEVPAYVTEELGKLSGSAADVFKGLQAMETREMETVLNLDAELAAVLPTDLWYLMSIKLRAEWRLQFTTPGYQPRMYNEATTLIDSAIAINRDLQLYLMRIRTTYLAGDIPASLATTSTILDMLDRQIARFENYKDKSKSFSFNSQLIHLNSVEQVIKGMYSDSKIQAQDLQSINDSISNLRNRIETLKSTGAS